MTTAAMTPLHTLTRGAAGPRLVFLHGLFGQGRNWASIGARFADRHRVIMVDLPDHGRSPWSERIAVPAMAERVAETLGDEPVLIVGHSLGGKVAMRLALDHPHLVERLVVVDIAPVPYRRIGQFATYVEGMRALDLDTLDSRAEADAHLSPAVPDPAVRGFLLQNLRRDGSGWRWQMNLRLLGDHLDQIGGWEATDRTYRGPTLWVAGADSDYITADHHDPMRALFPSTRLVRIKGAAHWVHSDQPDVFSGVLARFLAEDPAGP